MENRIRIYLLLTELVTKVLQKYLKHKAQPNSFEDFLKTHKHTLYHMCYANARCCLCRLSPNLFAKPIIRKEQLKSLFDEFNNRVCNNGNLRNCPCMYDPKPGIQTEALDITLCITILVNCFMNYLSNTERNALEKIRIVRNTVSHVDTNTDFTTQEYNRLWVQATTAVLDLSKYVSQQYDKEIQERINLLKTRPVDPTEYTETFRKMAVENSSNKEHLEDIVGRLGNIETQLGTVQPCHDFCFLNPRPCDTRDGHHNKSRPEERKPLAATKKGIPWDKRYKTRHHDSVAVLHNMQRNLRRAFEESNEFNLEDRSIADFTEPRLEVLYARRENDVSTNDIDNEYFQRFIDIENIRKSGNTNIKHSVMYSILVYIMLRGSASLSKIEKDVLDKIHHSTYHSDRNSEYLFAEDRLISYFEELKRKSYLEQIENNFTISDHLTIKLLISSFGFQSPFCFVEFCSEDMLLDHVFPVNYETDNYDELLVENKVLACSLVKRLKQESEASSVGKFLRKLSLDIKEQKTLQLFCQNLLDGHAEINFEHMISFLDGITCNGTCFEVLSSPEQYNLIFHIICCTFDEYGNSIFHFIVAKYEDSDTFKNYIHYFCKNRLDVMDIENKYGQSPVDFATCLGRYEVISTIMSRCSTTEKSCLVSRIFKIFKEMMDESLTPRELALMIDLKTFSYGEPEDYKKIIKAIGKDNEIRWLSATERADEKEQDEKIYIETPGIDDISNFLVEAFEKGLKALSDL